MRAGVQGLKTTRERARCPETGRLFAAEIVRCADTGRPLYRAPLLGASTHWSESMSNLNPALEGLSERIDALAAAERRVIDLRESRDVVALGHALGAAEREAVAYARELGAARAKLTGSAPVSQPWRPDAEAVRLDAEAARRGREALMAEADRQEAMGHPRWRGGRKRNSRPAAKASVDRYTPPPVFAPAAAPAGRVPGTEFEDVNPERGKAALMAAAGFDRDEAPKRRERRWR